MKRREFLSGSVGVAGGIATGNAWSQALPCPPPSVAAAGGTNANTACPTSTPSVQADWLARSTAAGVMWAHDFSDPAEVTKFRWTGGIGNDPNNRGDGSCRHIANDGVDGNGCLEIAIPQGGTADQAWWRPFSALPGDRGYVSGPSWNANNAGQLEQWERGFYGHADYHNTGQFDGTDFHIQFRCKLSSGRGNANNPPGKLAFIARTRLTPNHEIVIQSLSERRFSMYTNFGSRTNSYLDSTQGQGDLNRTNWQPGGPYPCIGGGGDCWYWPLEEWVTVLIHVVPGHHNGPGDNPNMSTGRRDTGIQVWVARAGQTAYTKIWDKLDYIWSFDPGPFGFNAFQPSGYMNGAPAAQAWSHRFDQIIFSKQFIACPQV